MTDSQFQTLRDDIKGLSDKIDDVQQGLHGIMFKLLTASEITEIRSKMKNAPDIKGFPFWAIR